MKQIRPDELVDMLVAGVREVTFSNFDTGGSYTYQLRRMQAGKAYLHEVWYQGLRIGKLSFVWFEPTRDWDVLHRQREAINAFYWVWKRALMGALPSCISVLIPESEEISL